MKKTDDNRSFKIKDRGKLGELYVRKYLEQHGCTIVQMNYSSRWGEIDIIAENDVRIIFVEVKTTAEGSPVSGFERITPSKLRKFTLTVQQYLVSHPTDKQPRIDCAQVTVSAKDNSLVKIDYLKNASS